MTILTVLTNVLMLINNSIIATSFGVEMDEFNLGTNIGTFTFSSISVEIITILIPSYSFNRDNDSNKMFIFYNIFNFFGI